MVIGKKLYRLHTVADSMEWAGSHSKDAPDGSVFLGDIVTNALGRNNQQWLVQPGQLAVTILLKPSSTIFATPEDTTIRINQLSMSLGLGILGPLKDYGVKFKWPNDFVIGTKKIGRMHMQLICHGTQPQSLILGFALNVNNTIDLENQLTTHATSLQSVTGQELDRRALYKDTIAQLNHWYLEWKRHNFADIYKQWRSEQSYLGTILNIHANDGSTLTGHAQQVLPNGDLLLIDQERKQKLISFYQVEEIATR
jgi:BirA family transcriptional regulator, biotin operon repressor / biotin---[acetyl-CoA-carboxylase] ligase